MTEPRRAFSRIAVVCGLLLTASLSAQSGPVSAAADVPGRILFVRDTGIWVWQAGDVSPIYKAPGIQDARWSPTARQIVYVQTGNSYSDLVIFDIQSGTGTAVTYNQAVYEEGTPEYVQASAWALEPDWSASGIIGFMSDYAESGRRPFNCG